LTNRSFLFALPSGRALKSAIRLRQSPMCANGPMYGLLQPSCLRWKDDQNLYALSAIRHNDTTTLKFIAPTLARAFQWKLLPDCRDSLVSFILPACILIADGPLSGKKWTIKSDISRLELSCRWQPEADVARTSKQAISQANMENHRCRLQIGKILRN
jgi:hypothetical protein